MASRRLSTSILCSVFFLALPVFSRAQTATNTPTLTSTRTPTNTPTDTKTKTPTATVTDTFSPNPTLTPPCGGAASIFGVTTTGSLSVGATMPIRASMFVLNVPATVYSIWLETGANYQVMTGIYSGPVSNIGSLIVGSAPQTTVAGWNGFSVTPTYLPVGTYWLAYATNQSSYNIWTVSSTTPNAWCYGSGTVVFGAMPANFPGPISYDSTSPFISDSIYAVYCSAPTSTPTASRTPTSTPTPTITQTPTNSPTPTSTGSPDTPTPTYTPTFTATITPSFTPTDTPSPTYSPTPNLSLTPDCGAAAVSFGDSSTGSGPVTAFSRYAFRACRYTLTQSGTAETMSLYLPAQDAGEFFVGSAIYSNNGSTMVGNLLSQSVTYYTSQPGWNAFQIAPVALTPGDYWLAYIYSGGAGTTFALNYQSAPPAGAPTSGNTACNFGPPPTGFTFPATGSFIPPTPAPPPPTPATGDYVTQWYEPIVANICPGFVATSTPSNTPTLTVTFTPTSTPTSPCGASATYFGSTNTTGSSLPLQPVEMLACRYSIPIDGTVYALSVYTSASVSALGEVALYSDVGGTMGTLLTQTSGNPQTLMAGWNDFQVSATAVTAGAYWLTYLYDAPVSFPIVYQLTGGTNTLAYDTAVTTGVFPASASSWPISYTNNFQIPIIADYCPGSLNTATPTNSPTSTATFTITGTPTPTSTSTLSMTPTFSPTCTSTGTPTWTPTQTASPTITNTPTITATLTSSPTSTSTGSPTWTGTMTATFTLTSTPTQTPTFTASSTPTASPSLTPSGTPTATGVFTPTSTPTATPSFTPTFTATSTMTSTASLTPSRTPTATPSLTPSGTPTPTGFFTSTSTTTSTPSSTPTLTNTHTATLTPTSTPSFTPTFSTTSTASRTPTSSPTATPSGTSTWTPTATWTSTPDAEISKSSSETVANVNDVVTFTLSLTVSNGSVAGVTVTDVLPGQLDLVGFGSTPPGGVTSWNASTKTLSWTFSSLPVGNYTITYQAQVTSAADSGSIITNQAQLAYSGLASPKTTSVNVAVAQTSPSLYPNPVRGGDPAQLQIPLNQPQDYLTVKVYTTAFRKVYEDTVKTVPAGVFIYGLDTTRFDGGPAANGLYYVVITTPSNRWTSRLLILK